MNDRILIFLNFFLHDVQRQDFDEVKELKDVSFCFLFSEENLCWMLNVGCWLFMFIMAVGCWLLPIGCWLLTVYVGY